MNSFTRVLLKALVMAAAISTYVGSAIAADAAASGAALEEVVITGSRIPQPNMKSTSPIQVVSSEEIKLQGTTDVSDLLRNMPQQFSLSNIDLSSTNNPLSAPGGVATADLRGLGPQRTLVLVDGRRLGIGDANTGNPNPSPDLNQIPAALIERVEVVTGGASAVYGSDAVAGVVNFIMKRDFVGAQIDGQYGFNMHTNDNALMAGLLAAKGFPQPKHNVTDGYTKEVSVVLGGNSADGKGNITAYFNYRAATPVSQGSRDFSACKLNAGPSSNTPACSGSPNSNEFIQTFGDGDFTVVGNQLLPWPQTGSKPPALFNSNPYQYLSHDDNRYSAGAFMHYDFSDALKLYSDLSWMQDRTVTQVAPSAAFEGGNPYSDTGGNLVNCSNPLLSAQQRAAICTPDVVDADGNVDLIIGRRNVEGGGRESDYDHQNYRIVLGLKGDIWDGWHYDVYGQHYNTYFYQLNNNYLSNQRINNSLQVVSVAGKPTCKSVVDGTDPACVPWNIWTDGGVTPAAVAYLNEPGAEQGTVKETTVAANLAGDLGRYGIKLPTATDGIGVSGGAEYRRDALQFAGDDVLASGDLSGFGGAVVAIDSSINVKEYYVEGRAPLVQNFTAIKDLVFDTGYRYSDYNLAGGVSTYKFGLQYAPTDDIRFRGSFQRAIRAPNIIDLFTPQYVTNTQVVSIDPCAGASPTASAAACARTGVTAAQYGHIIQCPAGQCATLQGGNQLLKPEQANTYSYGFTLSPRALPNFTASVDYYRIDMKDVISSIGIDISLKNCLATGDPIFCSSIVRTPTGSLFGTTIAGGGYIEGASINVANQTVSGVDVQAAYKWPLQAGGSLSAALVGSYLDKETTKPIPGEHTYDCSGLYGATCQGLFPSWRHTLRVSWKTPWDVLLSANWRYIGSVKLETNTSDVTLTNGKTDTFEGTLPSASYFDLTGSWDIKPDISVRFGINNLTDKIPPLVSSLIAGTGSPNTYEVYDLLGRAVFVGFTAKF